MSNNYINNLTINNLNNRLTIYFKNNVYNCDNDKLTKDNFRLHILSNDSYSIQEINNIFLNDKNSYTLTFNIDSSYIEKDSALLLELVNVYDMNMNRINSHQSNNYVYLYYEEDEDIIEPIIKKIVNKSNSTKIQYASKSSPLLAYNQNLRKYHLSQIDDYSNFYGKRVQKYPSSYYNNTYKNIIKPS